MGWDRKTGKPVWTGEWFTIVFLIGGVILSVAAIRSLGVDSAVNSTFVSHYYAVRGVPEKAPNIVFVSEDVPTNQLFEQVLAAGPKMVVSLIGGNIDHPNFVSQPPGAALPVQYGDSARVEWVPFYSLAGKSAIAVAAERMGVTTQSKGVRVNYGVEPLPTVSGSQILERKVPVTIFSGRVVVIGTGRISGAHELMTPLGAMSSAKIHTHALATLQSGKEIDVIATSMVWAGIVLLTVIAFWFSTWIRPSFVLPFFVAFCGGQLVLGYLVFSWHQLVLPVSSWILAMVGGGLVSFVHERINLAAYLGEKVAKAEHNKLVLSAAEALDVDRSDDWERFARQSSMLVDFKSAVVARLPRNEYHLNFEAFANMDNEHVNERRRDLRRSPYRTAYLLARPQWSERQFMKDESLRTLLVPLSALGRVFGFWILNFEQDRRISEREIGLISNLASEFSKEMERRRTDGVLVNNSFLGGGKQKLIMGAKKLQQSADSALGRFRDVSQVFESQASPALYANLWGDVISVNLSMRYLLEETQNQDLGDVELVTYLRRLTGKSMDSIRLQLRKLLHDRIPIAYTKAENNEGQSLGVIVVSLHVGDVAVDGVSVANGFVVSVSPEVSQLGPKRIRQRPKKSSLVVLEGAKEKRK